MYVPHRRTFKSNTGDQNVFAPIELHKIGPKLKTRAKLTVINRYFRLIHLEQAVPVIIAVGPIPPVILAGVPIQCALSCNGDVFLFLRVSEGRGEIGRAWWR